MRELRERVPTQKSKKGGVSKRVIKPKHVNRTLIYKSYLGGKKSLKRGIGTIADQNREITFRRYCSKPDGTPIEMIVSTRNNYTPSDDLVWNFYNPPEEYPPNRNHLPRPTQANTERIYAVDRPSEKSIVVAIWYNSEFKTVRFQGSEGGRPFFYIEEYQGEGQPTKKLYGEITYLHTPVNSPVNSPVKRMPFFGKKKRTNKNSLKSLTKDLKKVLKMY